MHLLAGSGDFSLRQQPLPDALDPFDELDTRGPHLLAGCAHLRLQPQSSSQLWPSTGLLVLARPVVVLSCFTNRGAACRRPLSAASRGGHKRCADGQAIPCTALSVYLQECQSATTEYRSGW